MTRKAMSPPTAFRDRIKGLARLPGDRIEPAAKNFRTHDDRQRGALRGLLTEIGIAGAGVVWIPDSKARAALRKVDTPEAFGAWLATFSGKARLIDGHLRREELASQDVPVLVTDLDGPEAAKALATFDAVSDLAGVDAALLASLLGDIGAPSEEGTADLLTELRKHLPTEPPSGDDDDPPPPDPTDALVAKWGTAQGQLWIIEGAEGREHRILCGDCRKPEDVARLFNGARCNIAFTSPPYASQRKYDPASGFRPIHPDKFVEWFEAVQANVRSVLASDGSWFVNIKEHCDDGERHLYVKDLTIAHRRTWGWRFIDELCWRKNSYPGDFTGRFKNGWEPVFHFSAGGHKWRPEGVLTESAGKVGATWAPLPKTQGTGKGGSGTAFDGARPDNVIECMGTDALGHAAAFPVALPAFFLLAYTDAGDAAYDPFMGSGTTLIAAEKTGRIAYGCELSPRYVAVILERAASKGMRPRREMADGEAIPATALQSVDA